MHANSIVTVVCVHVHVCLHFTGVSELPALIRRVRREVSGERSVQRTGAAVKVEPG